MFDSPDQAENRDQNENHAAGQDATDDGQIGHDGRCTAIDSDADEQEANHLKERRENETIIIDWFCLMRKSSEARRDADEKLKEIKNSIRDAY